ncbi:TetR/AcrR family transcriptional regulator [Longispora sp. K20-0274]|uniref:TetR/AcrR family transcriptional regulator n=1 Tax=Longispora sp. K20-0274 TaxID=3088255 RepID=UPI0039996693
MSGDQARTVELLWGPGPRPSRGPKPSLSLARIVATAIAVADAEGLAAVSMQRIAGELDFTKMSLYRYVPGKAELAALMVDTALGAPPDLDPTGGWRPALHAWSRHLWAAFGRHPWALTASEGARVPGPNELGWLEAAVAALADTGLAAAERLDAVAVLASHLRGLAHQTMTFTPDRPGTTERAAGALLAELLADRADRYPALAAAVAGAARGGQDDAVEFGVARILDGLGLLIAERSAG